MFIASTGGSTGEPKSVMLNDECFNIAVHQYLNSDLKYKLDKTIDILKKYGIIKMWKPKTVATINTVN